MFNIDTKSLTHSADSDGGDHSMAPHLTFKSWFSTVFDTSHGIKFVLTALRKTMRVISKSLNFEVMF